MSKSDIGVIGLGVMGENLALNMISHGYKVSAYNRSREKAEHFLQRLPDRAGAACSDSYQELVSTLKSPRTILLMVKAGPAVDEVISGLLPYLESGDIIIDGGNSFYLDTERRCEELAARSILFVGCGISGGEKGALHGPSMMPGGNSDAWGKIKDILQAICAKAGDGAPCCDWVGPSGSGHYTKMVHNGIEYGDMQLICEAYQLMRDVLRLSCDKMAEVFKLWNDTELNSYLIEITSRILSVKDDDGLPLVDKIVDAASQKGTGKWTSISALDGGVPLPLITEAVFARCLSSQSGQRKKACEIFAHEMPNGEAGLALEDIRKALLASKIISYAQGFSLLSAASEQNCWGLDLGAIALLWRNGCIIRSPMLDEIKRAYAQPGLSSILFSTYFSKILKATIPSLRIIVSKAAMLGVAIPAMSSALSYFDGLTTPKSSANLLQAQRDCFGAHTFERTDREAGEHFHAQWM